MKCKNALFFLFCFIFLLSSGGNYLRIRTNSIEDLQKSHSKEEAKFNYRDTMKVKKEALIFEKKEEKFIPVGKLSQNSVVVLDGIENVQYKLKDTSYYMYYQDLEPYDNSTDSRYKNYLPLGKKITTTPKFSLFQTEGETLSIFNQAHDFSLLYIDDDKYYIEYNNQLYYLTQDFIDHIEETTIDSNSGAQNIAVLNYHFFYDKTYESCRESICLEKGRFEEQLRYLQENKFLTLTMNEFNLWMDGNLRLPKNSVLLTVDDGALGTNTHLIELLEKYQMNATLFLITAWWPRDKYDSPQLEIYSHGYDIHLDNYCSKGPRGLCLTKEKMLEDLSLSIPLVDSNLAFCYPFYRYNQTMLESLKELDFKLAFVGGYRKASRSDNKLLIPRYPIQYNISLEAFKHIVN